MSKLPKQAVVLMVVTVEWWDNNEASTIPVAKDELGEDDAGIKTLLQSDTDTCVASSPYSRPFGRAREAVKPVRTARSTAPKVSSTTSAQDTEKSSCLCRGLSFARHPPKLQANTIRKTKRAA